MNQDKFPELISTAGDSLHKNLNVLREKAEHFIAEQLEVMKEEEKIVDLKDDELDMIKAYQAFKNRSKPGSIFHWTTPVINELVFPVNPTLIIDPREVSTLILQ